jgi:hypothetical protein
VPAPDLTWFPLFFLALWLVACALLSFIGGWHELSQRFESTESLEGERFSFRSATIGWGAFPVSYRSSLFVTVGRRGMALSILFPFRFLHPRLVIPWSAIERCEPVRYWFTRHVAVHVIGFRRKLLFRGAVGDRILQGWLQAGRGARPDTVDSRGWRNPDG